MDLLERWHVSARALIPAGGAVWDAHTHTGSNDPDGVVGNAERLLEKLEQAGHVGAVVTSSQDPAGYASPNDRILREAKESGGALVPFLRVDPRSGREAVAEAERSLVAGHRGIKLHPRAEQFRLSDPTVLSLARVAADSGAPLLVHAGRGISSLGRDAADLCDRVDGLRLILAHAAISDLSWLGPAAEDQPGLYFDTAWWDVTDLLALYAWVPPGRILYASDTPYGHPMLAFILTMRVAASARYSAAQLGALFGGTLWRLLNGAEGEDLGAAPGDGFVTSDPGLLRVHASLHGAIVQAFARGDVAEPMSLARLGCVVSDSVRHAAVYASIAAILDEIDIHGPRSGIVRPLIVAATAALTPDVAVPGS